MLFRSKKSVKESLLKGLGKAGAEKVTKDNMEKMVAESFNALKNNYEANAEEKVLTKFSVRKINPPDSCAHCAMNAAIRCGVLIS